MTRRNFVAASLASGISLLASGMSPRWMALNVRGDVVEEDWPDATKPVCLGSLLKPFLALAFLATHAQSPRVECGGTAAGCWRAQGHGSQDIVSAIANSCNVYFLRLAASIDRAALDGTCLAYGLLPPAREWTPSRLIGLDNGWPQAPLIAAKAFAALARNRNEQGMRTVLGGMAQCARNGTARGVDLPCFAKTGTAQCHHLPGNFVDGYVVSIYPLDQPRHIILAMRHNTSGAHTADPVRPIADRLMSSAG